MTAARAIGRRGAPLERHGPASLAALAVLLLAQTGCYAIASAGVVAGLVGGAGGALVAAGTPAPERAPIGSAVSVTFAPPADLVVVGVARDSARLRGVSSVLGRVTAARADTLWIALAEVQSASGRQSYPASAGPIAPVMVRRPGVAVRTIARRADVTTSVAVGVALGVALGLAGMFSYCAYGHRCHD